MHATGRYDSPLGKILIASDAVGIVGVWFDGQKNFARCLDAENAPAETIFIADAKRWLDVYFSGNEPDFSPKIHLLGTDFQIAVWNILKKIPYGKTTTYGDIARALRGGNVGMSARAVGNAVGKNNISLIVPCHRVVGTNGKLCGYAGGTDKKIALLKLESAQKF